MGQVWDPSAIADAIKSGSLFWWGTWNVPSCGKEWREVKHFYCYHLWIFAVSKGGFSPQWLSCLAFPNPCHSVTASMPLHARHTPPETPWWHTWTRWCVKIDWFLPRQNIWSKVTRHRRMQMRGGGEEEEGPTVLTSRAKEEYEVHVGAESKPPPPPHCLLRLNIKPMINTSCSFLRRSVNKHCRPSLKVMQERDVGSIASTCPFFFHLHCTGLCWFFYTLHKNAFWVIELRSDRAYHNASRFTPVLSWCRHWTRAGQ